MEVYPPTNVRKNSVPTKFWQIFKLSPPIGGRNNGQSTDMTGQILPFVRPEFSVIIQMTGHFFS